MFDDLFDAMTMAPDEAHELARVVAPRVAKFIMEAEDHITQMLVQGHGLVRVDPAMDQARTEQVLMFSAAYGEMHLHLCQIVRQANSKELDLLMGTMPDNFGNRIVFGSGYVLYMTGRQSIALEGAFVLKLVGDANDGFTLVNWLKAREQLHMQRSSLTRA